MRQSQKLNLTMVWKLRACAHWTFTHYATFLLTKRQAQNPQWICAEGNLGPVVRLHRQAAELLRAGRFDHISLWWGIFASLIFQKKHSERLKQLFTHQHTSSILDFIWLIFLIVVGAWGDGLKGRGPCWRSWDWAKRCAPWWMKNWWTTTRWSCSSSSSQKISFWALSLSSASSSR